jgi:hypothetical protein
MDLEGEERWRLKQICSWAIHVEVVRGIEDATQSLCNVLVLCTLVHFVLETEYRRNLFSSVLFFSSAFSSFYDVLFVVCIFFLLFSSHLISSLLVSSLLFSSDLLPKVLESSARADQQVPKRSRAPNSDSSAPNISRR